MTALTSRRARIRCRDLPPGWRGEDLNLFPELAGQKLFLDGSSGNWATWQPRYAAVGVATFPLAPGARKPLVTGPEKIGLKVPGLMAKFGDADAFGFICGPRHKLTVGDVDEAGGGPLKEALRRHGDTPVIVRTSSNKHHLYYRYNGEKRWCKQLPDSPVDVIGGGLIVAPKSLRNGGVYEFVRGSIDDLAKPLPTMQGIDSLFRERPDAANDDDTHEAAVVPVGRRTVTLWRMCMRELATRRINDRAELLAWALAKVWSSDFEHPATMTEAKINSAVNDAWHKTQTGRNYFGRKRRVDADGDAEVLGLMVQSPDAFALLMMLRLTHGDYDEFPVPGAMREDMGGWTLRRLIEARRFLEGGWIELVRPADSHKGPALFRWSERWFA